MTFEKGKDVEISGKTLLFLINMERQAILTRLVCVLATAAAVAGTWETTHRQQFGGEDEDDHEDHVSVRGLRRELAWASYDSLSPREFRKKYRVTKDVFDHVLGLIEDDLSHGGTSVPPLMMLLIFLEKMGHGVCNFHLVCSYGLNNRLCHHVLHKVAENLRVLGHTSKMCWPTYTEQIASAAYFAQKQPLIDKAFGAIDGTHVRVRENKDQKHYFMNRKGFSSITVMAVCDAFMRFIWVTVGAPGAVHDARVYRNSSLPETLFNPNKTLPEYYLLGDPAYGNRTNLLCPSEVEVTAGQNRFNYAHSSVRMTIERTFGVLKGMWKVFELGQHTCKTTSLYFLACCVLHNCVIDTHMDINEYLDLSDADAFDNGVREGGAYDHATEYDDDAEKEKGKCLRDGLIRLATLHPELVPDYMDQH